MIQILLIPKKYKLYHREYNHYVLLDLVNIKTIEIEYSTNDGLSYYPYPYDLDRKIIDKIETKVTKHYNNL